MYNILAQSPIFIRLEPKEIESLLNSVPNKIKRYEKNESIAESGSEIRNLLIILQGSVRGEMVDYSGKIVKIEDIERPRTLAPAFIFGVNNHFPVNIRANTYVEILSIPKLAFIELLQKSPIALQNYLNIVSNQAQFLTGKIKFLTFKSIKSKIASYLLEVSNKMGADEFTIPKSQNQLAEIFGVTRPSLGRAIREMHDDQLIDANGKQFKIKNKTKLSDLIR